MLYKPQLLSQQPSIFILQPELHVCSEPSVLIGGCELKKKYKIYTIGTRHMQICGISAPGPQLRGPPYLCELLCIHLCWVYTQHNYHPLTESSRLLIVIRHFRTHDSQSHRSHDLKPRPSCGRHKLFKGAGGSSAKRLKCCSRQR